MSEGFTLLPAPPGKCQECAVDHDPKQPHDAQSMFYQYKFRSVSGRWPTWKDAIAHCEPEVRELWETELRGLGHWTEPTSEVPDVMPTEDGTIGTVRTVPIEAPKKQRARKRKGD